MMGSENKKISCFHDEKSFLAKNQYIVASL